MIQSIVLYNIRIFLTILKYYGMPQDKYKGRQTFSSWTFSFWTFSYRTTSFSDIQLYGTSSSVGHPALSDIQLFRTSSFIGHPALSDIQLYWTSNSIRHPALSKFRPLSDIQLNRTSSWQTSNCRKPPAGPVFSHII